MVFSIPALGRRVSLVLFAVGIAVPAYAADSVRDRELREFLQLFRKDTKTALSRLPEKRDQSGRLIVPRSRFGGVENDLADVTARDRFRQRACMEKDGRTICLGPSQGALAPIAGSDQAGDLVEQGIRVRTLSEMEERELLKGRVARGPWSGDYWPYFKGVLGQRFADEDFPGSRRWLFNWDYVSNNPASSLIRSGRASYLAPAEKYDRLVGDSYGTLTAAGWNLGAQFFNSVGKVEFWMGICEGWAAAAIALPRPVRPVTVRSADGFGSITFLPDDLKGLSSLLWAYGQSSMRFIGGRCNVAEPQRDANGRVISPECFDTNPGTWHLAVVNQVGVHKKSFILDATFDYQVWNQPVLSYSFSYFNPQTLEPSATAEASTISLSRFRSDPFSAYRSWGTDSVVGIAMDLTYVSESNPSTNSQDSPEGDQFVTVRYVYDLELDADGRIIGGEWYSRAHPDFLWTPTSRARAVSSFDYELAGSWDGASTIPWQWQGVAPRASSYNQPLGAVVEALFRRAAE